MKEKLFELINKCFSKPESEDFKISYQHKNQGLYVLTFIFNELPKLEIHNTVTQNGNEYVKETVYTLSDRWRRVDEKLIIELENKFKYNGNKNGWHIKPVFIPEESLTENNKNYPYYTDPEYDFEKKYSNIFRKLVFGKMWEKTEVERRVDLGSTKKQHISFGSIKENISQEEFDEIIKNYEDFRRKKDFNKLIKRIDSI